MNLSTLTGRPAYDGGCYHCKQGAKPCICPGNLRNIYEAERKQTMDIRPMTQVYPEPELEPEEHLFPRRRDVRDSCKETLYALLEYFDAAREEFDRDFLTGVRDLMREGVPFEDAVGSFAPESIQGPGSTVLRRRDTEVPGPL